MEKFPLLSGRNPPNRLAFHIPPTNCSVLAVRDGEQNVSSKILMHAPSTRSFLSFLLAFFLSFFLQRGPPRGRQHVKYCSEDKGNYLLEWEQWSSFAQTPKSDSECCNCLPLTLTVILLCSAVTVHFSMAFQKLSLSSTLMPELSSNHSERISFQHPLLASQEKESSKCRDNEKSSRFVYRYPSLHLSLSSSTSVRGPKMCPSMTYANTSCATQSLLFWHVGKGRW